MDNKIKILLAEDDESLGTLLKDYLIAKSYDVDLYTNGQIAFENFKQHSYNLCVLDVMMPVKDGFALAKEIREINSDIPIIFLTAKAMKDDVLEGFKIGADDYISKPFNMDELIYRIQAVMRRMKSEQIPQKDKYTIGKFHFDVLKQTLTNGGESHRLTTKESELLAMLCQNMNSMLERNYALKTIWYDDNYFNARSMDVYITKLRKFLKSDPNVQIVNVHGKGFKLLVEEVSV